MRIPKWWLAFTLAAILASSQNCKPVAAKREVRLSVQVLYADPGPQDSDSRSRQVLASLPSLPSGHYMLRDEAVFHLEPHTAGRLQLPDRTWLHLVPQSVNDTGQAEVTVELSGVQLHANVLLTSGSTLAIGGSPFGRGHLLVALRYL